MTEPHDEIQAWLGQPIEPLAPPPGTYERIRHRARRRRRRQGMAAAATAAAVVAGLVAAPKLITFFPAGSGPVSAASSTHAAPSAGGAAPGSTPGNRLTASPTVLGTGRPVPDGFAAMSATFVGLKTGWALGTSSAQCSPTSPGCLALARTDNTGADWYSVPAPPTGMANDGTGVSQVRFLNRDDGWVFGPELWWTRDGGQSWQRVNTGGERVISLEAVGTRAFAVFARCAPVAPSALAGSAGCSRYRLYSAAAGTAAWRPVPGATSGAGTATVVLAHNTGYLLAGNGATVRLSSGPVSGPSAWHAVSTPCRPGRAASGPAAPIQGALLATAAAGRLFAVCPAGTGGQAGSAGPDQARRAREIVTSADGGRSWHRRAIASITGTAWSAAAAPGGGALFIATSTGLYASLDGGTTWRLALTGPPGGFSYVGMTDVLQGFAIPATHGQYGILFTTDGGGSWKRSMVAGRS